MRWKEDQKKRETNRRMVAFYGLAGILCLAVAAFAVMTAPHLSPAVVVYPEESEDPDPAPTAGLTGGSQQEQESSAGPSQTPEQVGGKLNLNTATKDDLMTLDGIGEVLAERILAYREQYGGFDSVEELMQVEGIGEKRFAAMEPYVTV